MVETNDKLSYAVIGKAMEVHRELGPGLDEILYHELLSARLTAAGIEHEFKPHGRLEHRGLVADEFEADLLVPRRLVVELKTLRDTFAPEHFVQIICYLKFWGVEIGLLMDFAKESLIHRRVAYSRAQPAPLSISDLVSQMPGFVTDKPLAASLCEALVRILSMYGPGYRDTTYRGLVFADLSAEKIACVRDPTANIHGDGLTAREAKLNCLAVPEKCALLILALRDHISAADRAILQTYLKHLDLPWGLVVNFGKRELELMYVSHPETGGTAQ